MQLLLLFLACRPDADSKPDDGTVDSQNLRPLDGDGDGWDVESGDCDDSDASVYPGATELCDGEDDNCDGVVDEGVQSTFYADTDGDGYGEPSATRLDCMAPDGYVALGTDCDDTNVDIHPDAPERCNTIDDDCDGQIDEDVTAVWYYDADQDGYGDLNTSIDDCNPPSGYVVDATDCDDSSAEAFPGHPEICDTRDNDCNGLTDDGVTTIWYADTDGDGYGQSSLTQAACAPPEGYVAADGDCDDQNAAIYPTADELCNGVDDNCDGQIDEDGAADAPLWYADNDSDGYGNIAVVFSSCELPTGYVSNADDCDDSDLGINPAALETCNGIDDNCDGQVDENSAVDAQNWYADGDGDGYGDARVVLSACAQPAGYVADLSDCDDGAAQAHPGAVESCDLLDNDCDGIVDNNATDALTWYQDADGDRFGDANSIVYSCYAPAGYVSTSTDCDDSRADVWPNAPEVCDNADNDCDTQIDEGATDALTWYQDADQDGFGNSASILRSCSQPAGYVADARDCNDQANLINPAAAELCDGVDNDCDTRIDQNAVDAPDWYIDVDGDGFGNSRIYQASCSQPAGYVADATDCDDLQLSTHPGADEYCDGIDNNCNGSTDESTALDALDWYRDADQDGFGTVNLTQRACTQPSGYVADASDCDDASNSNYPGATEVCDMVDNNCDGTVDDPADLLGSAAACGARNCAEIQSTRLVAGDGEYWLSFNNSPLVVYCDMQTAGGGWTVIHPDDIGTLGSLNSMRDDTTRAMAYLRDNNGNRYYTEVEQLAAFNTYPVRVEDQDSSRMRITFVPRPDSNVQGQTQGFRSNGQDLTFTNCDGNGNSYIEFWHTGLNYVWNQDYRISLQWRDSKIASPSTVPDDYFTYTAIHFGGCGTHSTSGYWSAYDNMRDAAIAIY